MFSHIDVFNLMMTCVRLLYIGGDVVLHRGQPINVLETEIAAILPGEGPYSQAQLQAAAAEASAVQAGIPFDTVRDAWELSDPDEPATLAQVPALLLLPCRSSPQSKGAKRRNLWRNVTFAEHQGCCFWH